MGFLTEYEDSSVLFKGRVYTVDLSFDAVLNIQRMFHERRLEDSEMLVEALGIFGASDAQISQLSWEERSELLQLIFEEKVQTRPRPNVGNSRRLFDFEEDGEYIYASFLQDYGMDLIDQQGKLSWPRFISLFQGLSDKTKIKEVMRIRAMEIPKPTGTNQKEIQNLLELKAYYDLGYHADNGKEGLERLFTTLEGICQS